MIANMLRDLCIVVLLSCCLLLPFIGKAFHVDDPLFVWSASHLLSNPLDPFSVEVNWAGKNELMWDQMKNPPLVPYYEALGIRLLGDSEIALHLWCLPLTVGAAISMYFLSRRYTRRPLWPTLALVFCPAFLVSATSVMADIPALFFFLTGLLLFEEGTDRDRHMFLAIGAACLGFAALAKYLAVGGFGLAAIYVILHKRSRAMPILLWLIIPLGMFGLWGVYGILEHGKAHFALATSLRLDTLGWSPLISGLVCTFSFIGGCAVFPVIFVWAILKRWWVRGVCFVFGLSGCIAVKLLFSSRAGLPWQNYVALFLFISTGVALVWLAVRGLREPKAQDWHLKAWLLGVFVFCAFLNWTVNARTVLFLMPPTSLLLWIEMEKQRSSWLRSLLCISIGITLMVAVLVTATDYRMANSYRSEAQSVRRRGNGEVYFPNHWGFQYYMEKKGFQLLVPGVVQPKVTDLVVAAEHASGPSTWLNDVPGAKLSRVRSSDWPLRLHTMNFWAGAGFYSNIWGPLPYGFGPSVIVRFPYYEISTVASSPLMRDSR